MEKPSYAEPPLDSFRRHDALAKWQWWASWVCPALALVWVAVATATQSNRFYAPGRVAAVHSAWNDRCDVCHTTSQPMSAGNWFTAISGEAHVADEACARCHQGPPHHKKQDPNKVAACTACHVEHRGEQALLTRVADVQCVRCHKDPGAHALVAGNGTKRVQAASAFAPVLHPPYEPVDTGRLAFNHKKHLMPGLALEGDKARFLVKDLAPEWREQYGVAKVPENTPVQLECRHCHELDRPELAGNVPVSRLPGALLRPVRPAGATMLPITYEAHCQACHPLSVGNPGDVVLKVPHRLSNEDLHTLLEGVFSLRYLRRVADSGTKPKTRPLPGHLPGSVEPLKALEEAIQEPIARAEILLFESRSGCALCHELTASKRDIVPTRVPDVWLTKASFDHAAHRLVHCQVCHRDAETSLNSADVLIPRIDTCFDCHSASRPPAARSDCVECHRYHQIDSPRAGHGTTARGPKTAMDLQGLLHTLGRAPVDRPR